MQLIHDKATLTQLIKEKKQQGQRIGFVPTMGNLHAGHISLVKKALQHCDFCVASVFVNPMQFGANEDLDKYPRTLEEDAKQLQANGCNCLFAPSPNEIYPNGLTQHLKMNMPHMAAVLCGKSRPTHFEGVCTVVTKLFNLVRPDIAVFGKKDLQQLLIIKAMTKDLCLPIEIMSGDTQREDSGLAMSSRNSLLSIQEREQAATIYSQLQQTRDAILDGNLSYQTLIEYANNTITSQGLSIDYFEIRTLDTLAVVEDGKTYDNLAIFAATYAEKTRLIDNITLHPID